MNQPSWNRRRFMGLGVQAAGAWGLGATETLGESAQEALTPNGASGAPDLADRDFNAPYTGAGLDRVAFPLGGIGAGMICLEGAGSLSKVSICNEPDLVSEPAVFAGLSINGNPDLARLLEGPVAAHKLVPTFSAQTVIGNSAMWGLPRFKSASFAARFPFATVTLTDPTIPVGVQITGWSPFVPGDEDSASLPVAGLEYQLTNRSARPIDAVFSFHSVNFMASVLDDPAAVNARVRPIERGFVLEGARARSQPWTSGAFAVSIDSPQVKVNHQWFRGRNVSFDALRMAWLDIAKGACYERAAPSEGRASPGASAFVPVSLAPGESKTLSVRLAWYVGESNVRVAGGKIDLARVLNHNDKPQTSASESYRPWYALQFASIEAIKTHWDNHYAQLRESARVFSDTFFASTLPPEVLEAVAAHLTVLKSPTVLRQSDGRFWGWEGSGETLGICEGSCTHVWNYAQALAHLFPRLERTLRETEFEENQNAQGHQDFRAALPIRPTPHNFPAAADGQLGGIMKVHRDWRISGDTAWVRRLWPKIRVSLDYAISTWDPRKLGWLDEPQHNTYDVEWWGPNGMCTSMYLGALKAATLLGAAMRDDTSIYADLLARGLRRLESELFNGEFFIQKVEWRDLRAPFPEDSQRGPFFGSYSSEALALASVEGPEHQYGEGCLADGIVGAWMAWVCGIEGLFDREKTAQHLASVYRYNFDRDRATVANPTLAWRVNDAVGSEAGLSLCSWPRGKAPTVPFFYANEVWVGVEYQVASHLIAMGKIQEGLEIVRACRRRYDGRIRNPFDYVEAGHWYARGMSSYALLQAFSGARYDAVTRILHLTPAIPGDFQCFLSTATGYGLVGVKGGRPFLKVATGEIPIKKIEYVKTARDLT
jgi:uncharacterized protein (DUF608 family)